MVEPANRRDAVVHKRLAERLEVGPRVARRHIDAALLKGGDPVVDPAEQLHIAGQVEGVAG